KNLVGAKVASAAAFNEMKTHVQNLYKDLKVTHSFTGHDGQPVDVVSIDQQPSLKHALLRNHKVERTAPTLLAMPKAKAGKTNPTWVQHLTPHLAKGMKDKDGKEMFSPEGSIAIRRVTLNEMVKFSTLKEYFKKHGTRPKKVGDGLAKPEFVASDGYTHRYAEA